MSLRHDHDQTSLTRLFRAVGYALTSVAALFSGYWIRTGKVILKDHELLLLIAAEFLSLPFYSAYSATFSPRHSQVLDAPELHQEKHNFLTLCLIGGALSGLTVLLYQSVVNDWSKFTTALPLFSFPLCLVAYGIFLLWWYPHLPQMLLRYQLIWPICLSIAFPFYIGSNLLILRARLSYLFPLVFFLLYLIVAESLARSRKRFFWLSMATILVSAFLIFVKPLHYVMLSFLFAIAVAAYAAVFESWSVTAREAFLAQAITPKVNQYFLSTMAVLVLSGLAISALYIFSAFGSIFLWLVGAHFALAFIIWHRSAPPSDNLFTKRYWARDKVFMGMCIFAILLMDALFQGVRRDNYISLFTSPLLVTALITIWPVVIGRRLKLPVFSVSELNKYFADKRRFVEALWVLFLLIFVYSYGFYNNAGRHFSASYASRVTLGAAEVFDLYVVFTVLAIVYLLFARGSRKNRPGLMQRASAALLLVRSFTSLAVGVSVCLALYSRSEQLATSVVLSIPFVLACMGGFALNDFFDQENDAINRPYRAIPSKILNSNQVLTIGIFLSVGSILFGMLVADNYVDRLIYVSTAAGIVAYNLVVRYFGVMKTIYTGVLAAVPYIMVLYKGHFGKQYWLFIAASVMFVTGRELLMDAYDEAGDRAARRKTLAIVFGSRNTLILGTFFQIAGAVAMIPLAITSGTFAAAALVASAFAAAVICVVLQLLKISPRVSIYACWIPMILGLAVLCIH